MSRNPVFHIEDGKILLEEYDVAEGKEEFCTALVGLTALGVELGWISAWDLLTEEEQAEADTLAAHTLADLGTPWAECYRGSGRLTGRLAEEPAHQANGNVAPGWTFVGRQTEEEFWAAFTEQEHDQCHRPGRYADHRCPHCAAAG